MALSATEQQTWRSLVMLSHALEEALDRQSRRDGGIPHAYYKLLIFLYEAGDRRLSMSELAATLRYSSSRLTHAVSSLERSGWAQRVRSSDDRRVQYVQLTDAGAEVVRRVTPGQVAEVREPLFRNLTPEQTTALGALARSVVAALEAPLPQTLQEG